MNAIDTMYSIRGKRAARTYVYGQGVGLEHLKLESLEQVQLIAQRYYPGECRFKKVDLTRVFLRFQRKVRSWVAWRRAVRGISVPRVLLKRELEGSDLAAIVKENLRYK